MGLVSVYDKLVSLTLLSIYVYVVLKIEYRNKHT